MKIKSYILNAEGFLLFSMKSVCFLSAIVYVLVTLNKKCSARFLFKDMVPSWSQYFGRLWKLSEMENCWRTCITRGGP